MDEGSRAGRTTHDFRVALDGLLGEAEAAGLDRVDVEAADLFRAAGCALPGDRGRVPVCCALMHVVRRHGDEMVAGEPRPELEGLDLVVRYRLPR
jgi:hypothetical protein